MATNLFTQINIIRQTLTDYVNNKNDLEAIGLCQKMTKQLSTLEKALLKHGPPTPAKLKLEPCLPIRLAPKKPGSQFIAYGGDLFIARGEHLSENVAVAVTVGRDGTLNVFQDVWLENATHWHPKHQPAREV